MTYNINAMGINVRHEKKDNLVLMIGWFLRVQPMLWGYGL